MDTVTLELTWEEYQLITNCVRYTANTVEIANSQPELLSKIESLAEKVYLSRKIVKNKSGI
jgi:hypothetical protein